MKETVKEKKASPGAYYLRILGTLFVITAVVAVLLAGVNALTRGPIARHADQTKADAIAQVMPGADGFATLETPEGMGDVKEVLLAQRGGQTLGYCVQTSTNGNDGAIELMVGIDQSGAVTSVSILSQKETMYVNKHGELIAQFPGKSGSVALSQDGGDVSAISGATISSRAITKGVNSALAAVQSYLKGGAQ